MPSPNFRRVDCTEERNFKFQRRMTCCQAISFSSQVSQVDQSSEYYNIRLGMECVTYLNNTILHVPCMSTCQEKTLIQVGHYWKGYMPKMVQTWLRTSTFAGKLDFFSTKEIKNLTLPNWDTLNPVWTRIYFRLIIWPPTNILAVSSDDDKETDITKHVPARQFKWRALKPNITTVFEN